MLIAHYFFRPMRVLNIVIFILFVFPTDGAGENTRIVMVTEHWPPFRISDETRSSGFRGIDIDIAENIAKTIGVSIEIQHYPFARALEQMESGQADLITGVAYSPERAHFLYYVPVSYCEVRPVFYARKAAAAAYRVYEDLHGPSIGYSLDSFYFEPFNSDKKINRIGFSTETQLLKILMLGRVDVIVGTDPNISYEIRRLNYGSELAPSAYQPAEKTALYFALSRKSAAMGLGEKIAAALRRLVDTGAIEAIRDAYR